jgi:hypothetical protein
MKTEHIAQRPADPPLAEELSTDDVIFEMANLDKSQTGIGGYRMDFNVYDGTYSKSKIFCAARADTAKLLGPNI